MPSDRLCVFGCVTKGVTIHRFPNPEKYPERFRKWVELTGDILKDTSDTQIFNSKKVCDKHFLDNHKNRNNRLSALAIPVKHIPGLSPITAEVPFEPIVLDKFGSTMNLQQKPCMSQPSGSSITAEVPFEPVVLDKFRSSMNLQPKPCMSQPSGTRRKWPSLQYYNVTQKQIRSLRSEICRLKRKTKNFKTRLAHAENLSQTKIFENVTNSMSLPSKLFTNMQFRESSKKPKGRRFTMEEKILALALYKRSPKSYSLLSKCFTLPSAKSLKNLLGKIKIEPGINTLLFDKLKKTVNNMSADDCLCTLIFDEMSIQPQIHYLAASDELKGFTNIGPTRIADHALVFMVRGIKSKYKQPVAYYFTQSLNKFDLKKALQEVIKHVTATGLRIIATICDQSMVNVGAIDSLIHDSKVIFLKLGKPWRSEIMVVEKLKIIPLYDTPHLFKGIRNNLLTKDLQYIDVNKKEKIVKWGYFQQIYQADKSYGELRLLPKITEEHINVQKINKMKVKTAMQVFSHSMATATQHLFDSGKIAEECTNLIPVLLLLDKLFDSMNSNTFCIENGKIYRSGVRHNSPHHELWIEALRFLKTIKFINKKIVGTKVHIIEKTVPSVKNLIKTIEGLQAIWKILHNKYEFDVMLCRYFNQDPIENFFGCVRSLGIRNVAPNIINFEGAFKALLLNNFCSSHSLKANCEDDMGVFLQSLDFLLTETDTEKNKINDEIKEIYINEEILNNPNIVEGTEIKKYVCGWVLKKILQNLSIGGCVACKLSMFATDVPSNSSFITCKEYKKNSKWLCYPSNEVVECFKDIQNITTGTLKKNINLKYLKKNICRIIDIFVNFSMFNCNQHKRKVIQLFCEKTINVIIYSWCRSVNRILSGKISYDGDDEIKNYAKEYYIKNKHYKNKK